MSVTSSGSSRAPQSRFDLAPQPARDRDGGVAEVVGQATEFLRHGAWLTMLLVGWLLQKSLCALGWPEDCASDCDEQYSSGWSCTGLPWTIDQLGEAHGLQQLLVYGLFSGWLNAVGRPERFCYLFSPMLPAAVGSNRSHYVSGPVGRASTVAEREPLIDTDVAVTRRATVYGRSWRQRWRLPWFPLVFFGTIPVFSRITMCEMTVLFPVVLARVDWRVQLE